MKKLFTLTALALLVSAGVNAQKVRKTWDFREGFSSITVANLQADMDQNGATTNWRNYESDASKAVDYAFWCASETKGDDDGNIYTTVDGSQSVISETKGLSLAGIKAKGLVICYNYPQKENTDSPNQLYPYGNSFIWFNGKSLKFTFQAHKGDTLKMGVESHKNSEARGIKVSSSEGELTAIEGNSVPTYYNDVKWVIPDDTPDVDDYTTITVTTTNGCHIYYIIVGQGDNPDDLKDQIAYLYSGETDAMYNILAANSAYKVTPIDVTEAGKVSREALASYDVVALSSSIAADNANVTALKETLPYQPILNFNAQLYDAWGYGSAVKATEMAGVTKKASDPMFTGANLIPGTEFELDETYSGFPVDESGFYGVKLNSYFVSDDTLATVLANDDLIAIHKHNISHNGYVYMPNAVTPAEGYDKIVYGAVSVLSASKAEVTVTSDPTFEVHYGKFNATVSINSPEPNSQIYYTTDGTEPAIGTGTLYTEPFNLTAESTVKAIAQGEGYDPSAVADTLIKMYDQVVTPAIAVTEADDAATIRFETSTPGATIWYNFGGSADSTQSVKYTEPFVINDVKTISFFATAPDYVQSELGSEKVYIQNDKVYIDEIGHFDAGKSYGPDNNTYTFSWGKNAVTQYDDSQDPVSVETDADGNEVPVYPLRAAEVQPSDSVIAADGLEWILTSHGQSMVWQNINPGKDVADANGYNPAGAEDLDSLITNYDIQFYTTSSDQCNASIQSKKKFKGPFDIVAFVGTATGKEQFADFQVSTDSLNWTKVDSITFKITKRLWKKFTVSYDGTDEVYVRMTKANTGTQVYDIYIMNEGEKSLALEAQLAEEGKEYLEAVASGINEIDATAKSAGKVSAIYNVNGTKQNSLKAGLNIVKYSDGSVKKVLVK